MIVTPKTSIDKQFNKKYDVCIIGSGCMGLLLANELKDSGKRICVLESADESSATNINDAKRVESSDLHIRSTSRVRCYGGSTQVWGGLSGLLDERDMAVLDTSLSGWPISLSELELWLNKTAELYDYPNTASFSTVNQIFPLFRKTDRLSAERFLAVHPPVKYGDKLKHIFDDNTIDLLTGLTVTEILVDAANTTEISAVKCFSNPEKSIEITADVFVLAAGGIENPRLLLNSTSVFADGIGNQNDQVGRYFMNHPKGICGHIVLRDATAFSKHFATVDNGVRGYYGISFSEQTRAVDGLLHPYVHLVPMYPWSGHFGFSKIMAWKNILCNKPQPQADPLDLDIGTQHKLSIRDLISGAVLFAVYYYYKLCKKQPRVRKVKLRNYHEMQPSPDNRVTLADTVDLFGKPHARVDASLSSLEKESLIQLHKDIAKACDISGLGKLTSSLSASAEWPITQDAAHHMGTTRMGDDPVSSVVDSDQKVHGINNLYIAGTSVMPTGGNINPTFTGMALTLRMSERLFTHIK